jgi:hypothetical protein
MQLKLDRVEPNVQITVSDNWEVSSQNSAAWLRTFSASPWRKNNATRWLRLAIASHIVEMLSRTSQAFPFCSSGSEADC